MQGSQLKRSLSVAVTKVNSKMSEIWTNSYPFIVLLIIYALQYILFHHALKESSQFFLEEILNQSTSETPFSHNYYKYTIYGEATLKSELMCNLPTAWMPSGLC